MQIIFLKDVPKLGKKDDIKEMSEGYVRNFLLPQKLVEEATKQTLQKLAERKNIRENEKINQMAHDQSIVDALFGISVSITVPANEKGNLFKAVTSRDIGPLFSKVTSMEVLPEYFKDVHIKTIGEHIVIANIGGKNVKCNVIIEAK